MRPGRSVYACKFCEFSPVHGPSPATCRFRDAELPRLGEISRRTEPSGGSGDQRSTVLVDTAVAAAAQMKAHTKLTPDTKPANITKLHSPRIAPEEIEQNKRLTRGASLVSLL